MEKLLIQEVKSYLRGEVSTSELKEWLVSRFPGVFGTSEFNRKLMAKIQMGLIEMKAGVLDEEEFKEELKEFLTQNGIK